MEATNFHETGLETTVVATVGYRFLLYNMNLDLFSDFAAPRSLRRRKQMRQL